MRDACMNAQVFKQFSRKADNTVNESALAESGGEQFSSS